MDKAIVHIEILESKASGIEDIQLVENSEVKTAPLTVTYQVDHKDANFDLNSKESEQQAKYSNK